MAGNEVEEGLGVVIFGNQDPLVVVLGRNWGVVELVGLGEGNIFKGLVAGRQSQSGQGKIVLRGDIRKQRG